MSEAVSVAQEHEEPIGRQALRTRRVPEPLVRLNDNPILLAQARRRLRRKQVIPGVLISAILGVCAILFAASGDHDREGWQILMNTALGAIAVLVGLRGTMQTSSTIADERRSGILDFHRATPTTPWTDTIGYLLGSAAREYLLAAVLVPFALIGALGAGVAPVKLVLGLGVILLTGVLYQAMGLLSGLSINSRRGVSGGAVALVVLAQSMAVPLHETGFVTLSYLTPIPALTRLLGPEAGMGPSTMIEKLGASVPFFGVPLHPVLFTLLVQGSVLAFLLWAAARKIHREEVSGFSRGGAAAFFGLLLLLSFGGSWGLLTSDLKPSLVGVIAVTYVIAATVVATLLALALTPSYIEFLRALRRARRHGQPEASWLADGGPAWPLVGLFSALVVGGLVLMAAVMRTSGLLLRADGGECVLSIVAFLALVIGASEYTRLAQRKSARNVGILIYFLTMVLPWLLFGIATTAHMDSGAAMYLGALSPGFAVVGAGLRMAAVWGNEPLKDFSVAHLHFSLLVTSAMAAWFLWQTRRLHQALASTIPLGAGRAA